MTTIGSAPAPAALKLRGITKRFPGIVANDSIDLEVARGEVLAVLGENGAGKSTLMKVLYGINHPEAGTIEVNAQQVRIESPRDARRLGIGMVFQNFTVIPALTVAENIALALQELPFLLPRRAIDQQIRDLSARFGFAVEPQAKVRNLSLGERQRVEILKLLIAEARILIFDEPTSVLAPQEIDSLLEVFRRLRADGLAVLFITHKLREVLAVADRITVLRRGAVTATLPAEGASERWLVALMLGEQSQGDAALLRVGIDHPEANASDPNAVPNSAAVRYAPVVEMTGVNVSDPAGRVDLHDLTLTIAAGEIIGVAAVAGNGQLELGEMLIGLRRPRSGSLRIFDQDAMHWDPATAIAAGVACVAEDPLRLGAVPAMTVLENAILAERQRYAGPAGLSLDWPRARMDVARVVADLDIAFPPLAARVETLSGGNVQRAVLARELAREPRLLIAFYPTRGMDLPSAESARALLLRRRAAGAAVLLVSEDLDELFAMSDRLVVMHRGHIAGIFPPAETTPAEVGALMTGAGEHSAAVSGASASSRSNEASR